MGWVDIFRAFLTTCGLGVTIFVVVQTGKATRQMLREMEPISSEQRRENWRVAFGTIAGMLLGTATVYGAYAWGDARWDSRTGAAMAIGAFVIVMVLLFLAVARLGIRDARRDCEQRSIGR
jgi:cytochrome c biogenesis protein CcdA